jgi:hypothetical protein
MTDITLAAGLVARAGFAYDAGSRAPRQEWLGPARQTNRSTDQEDAGEASPLRLVGHKVLAQGAAGRTGRNRQDPAAESADAADPTDSAESAQLPATLIAGMPQIRSTPSSSSGYAARAIASFSQQLRDNHNLTAKGTRINAYA